MIKVMVARKMKMNELCEGITEYPHVLVKVKVKDKMVARVDSDVQVTVNRVVEEIGVSERILVRESGTEPLISLLVETESQQTCQKYVDEVVEVIKNKGHERMS